MVKHARCGGCGFEWNAAGQAHCASGCHQHFNSLAAFDRHRRDFECVPVADFGKPYGKAGKPLLVRISRADGDVWVTGLRDDEKPAVELWSGLSGGSE